MRRRVRSRTRTEGKGLGGFLCLSLLLKLSTRYFLSGLPLGLKVFGPWAHHTEEVGMRY